MYHKHRLHFFKKIAGVEKVLSKCQNVIFFIKNLQKYLNCTEKYFVNVQYGIDTENKIMQC